MINDTIDSNCATLAPQAEKTKRKPARKAKPSKKAGKAKKQAKPKAERANKKDLSAARTQMRTGAVWLSASALGLWCIQGCNAASDDAGHNPCNLL